MDLMRLNAFGRRLCYANAVTWVLSQFLVFMYQVLAWIEILFDLVKLSDSLFRC
jgi:hypothetical protein